mgnify:CR=1 FL=1
MRTRRWVLAVFILMAAVYGWFSFGQQYFRPAAGDSEAELIEWLDSRDFKWGYYETGSTTVRGLIDMNNNVGVEIIKLGERKRNGTVFTRVARKRTSGFCGGTYSMVFWRVDQDLNIAEIYYDTYWCFV